MNFILCLNDMRSPKIEILTPVARATTVEALKAFVAENKVPPYMDGNWSKCFRQGSLLEWYNPPQVTAEQDH